MAKTIKQIADEIGVTKQAVYKRFKGKLNTICAPYAHTEDGILYLDEQGEQIIKNDFIKTYYSNRDILECSNAPTTAPLEHSIGTPGSGDGITPKNKENTANLGETNGVSEMDINPLERSNGAVIGALECSNGVPVGAPKNDSINVEYVSEIEFLHRQIDRLQDELEKEREHNREKDRQLLDTLAKLAETQAALAAGQNAEKQKALAETLIEGQQMMDDEYKEQTEAKEKDFEEESHDESKKQGLFQRIWTAITNK